MSDIRELLELAARAMGIDVNVMEDGSGARRNQLNLGGSPWWNPLDNSGDCADMCAALGIGTLFPKGATREHFYSVSCSIHNADTFGQFHEGPFTKTERFDDHNNDRAAAWRMAALRVAAEIGRAKA